MTQGFFQFNNIIIDEILNFATSSWDLFFVSGKKGTSKSDAIEKVIPQLLESNLVFQHFCFANSVIDDFLLNFYDALRNFSLAQKFSLKKFTTDNFKEKVNHYFKTIDKQCIIIIENFEKVDENIEIIDFLSHLSTYENVKIIILTRNGEKNLFRFKKIKMKTFEMEQISKADFKSKLVILSEPTDDETKEKFYQYSKGLELYLKMAAKYCANAGVTIKDLINEYERKNALNQITFEDFLVSKFVSATPLIYQNFYKALSVFSHPISEEVIHNYKFGNIGYIDYLTNNFLVSKFKDEYYVKDYFKNYVVKNFSIQEKITNYNNLIKIYENELAKSPKDRLIRLSREAMRREIEYLKSLIPSIDTNASKNFSYIGIAQMNWHNESDNQKSKLSEKFNKIKERRRELTNNEKELLTDNNLKDTHQESLVKVNREKNRMFVVNLINSARDYTKQYRYNESINELLRAKDMDDFGEFEIEILTLIANNYEYFNDYTTAQSYYNEAFEIAMKKRDSRKCELEFLIASCSKNLYKIDIAKSEFKKIATNDSNSQNYRAKAYIELGELEEADSNLDVAIEYYKKAVSFALGKNKELTCRAYYKLATLYDENLETDKAVLYYHKNYTLSCEPKENKYYSISLTNLALISIEQSEYTQASEYLKLALMYDTEKEDLENMYFSQKELAKLYAKIDEISAIGYFKQALDSATKLNDNFKQALVYFELGEHYYDKEEDQNALKNFLKAQSTLKSSQNDENMMRIKSRINDIKMRLDKGTFNLILEKYDN